jgi:hypothetical protein
MNNASQRQARNRSEADGRQVVDGTASADTVGMDGWHGWHGRDTESRFAGT